MDDSIKRVDFYGDNLIAIKNPETKKIYTGVSYICNGIGLTKGQKDRQILNIQNDLVLNKGCLKFEAGVFDKNNSTIALDIDFLPLWLAKISITPTMQKEQPEIINKLIKYQLKAKDVLADAFVKSKPQCIEDVLIQSLQEMKDVKLQLQEVKQTSSDTKQEVQDMREVITIKPSEEWRKKTNILINRICMKSKNYEGTKREIYKALDERAGSDINKRLKNMKARVLLNGGTQTQANKLNPLDAIGNDKKLIEIYVAIVKEMSIKYGVA